MVMLDFKVLPKYAAGYSSCLYFSREIEIFAHSYRFLMRNIFSLNAVKFYFFETNYIKFSII